jgi:hypothetical protein
VVPRVKTKNQHSGSILAVFAPFATIFFKPKTASKAILLLSGAILCRGGRTVCAALKILGMQGERHFDKYHRVLNRASWSPVEGSKILLKLTLYFKQTQASRTLAKPPSAVKMILKAGNHRWRILTN